MAIYGYSRSFSLKDIFGHLRVFTVIFVEKLFLAIQGVMIFIVLYRSFFGGLWNFLCIFATSLGQEGGCGGQYLLIIIVIFV